MTCSKLRHYSPTGLSRNTIFWEELCYAVPSSLYHTVEVRRVHFQACCAMAVAFTCMSFFWTEVLSAVCRYLSEFQTPLGTPKPYWNSKPRSPPRREVPLQFREMFRPPPYEAPPSTFYS